MKHVEKDFDTRLRWLHMRASAPLATLLKALCKARTRIASALALLEQAQCIF